MLDRGRVEVIEVDGNGTPEEVAAATARAVEALR